MHQAYVVHRDTRKKARGFSCAEIEDAGMTCKDFDALKLPWDSMRKSKYAENIAYLKKMEKPAAKPVKVKKPAKK
jgi:ribosomal protein L13E